MLCKATGQLQHHFWGTYYGTLVLEFENADQANAVMLCGALNGESWGVFKQSDKHSQCIGWHGDSSQLECLKRRLGECGADVAKIDSLAKSIDHGEEFTITVEAIDPNQLSLFEVA